MGRVECCLGCIVLQHNMKQQQQQCIVYNRVPMFYFLRTELKYDSLPFLFITHHESLLHIYLKANNVLCIRKTDRAKNWNVTCLYKLWKELLDFYTGSNNSNNISFLKNWIIFLPFTTFLYLCTSLSFQTATPEWF